jgi:predicted MFS family arabinose efflux permease
LLAMTGFTAIITETMPAGLLPNISADLGISSSAVGQMVSLYALGSLLAAIPIVTLTQRYRRKPVLMFAIAGFLVFNFLTAISSFFFLTMVARFMAGVSAGVSWGLLGGYARRMVIDKLKGRAVALAMVGTPLALSIGTPLGTYVGNLTSWRWAFFVASAMAMTLLAAVAFRMPDFPGQPLNRPLRVREVLSMSGVRPILLTAFCWVTANYILYTYLSLFAIHVGMSGEVDLILLVFGFSALLGIWLSGAMVDRRLRLHVLGSLFMFALATFALALPERQPIVLWSAVAMWGMTFGGAATSIQTAASDAAHEGASLVSAMTTTVWNAGITCGGTFGALILAARGFAALFWAMLVLVLTAFVVATVARNHGFKAGARTNRLGLLTIIAEGAVSL